MDSLSAAILCERTPTAADIQHPVAGPQAHGIAREIELPGDGILQWLVVTLEDSLRVRPVPAVQEQQEELRILVVVVRDDLLVDGDLALQERLDESGREAHRMPVGEE